MENKFTIKADLKIIEETIFKYINFIIAILVLPSLIASLLRMNNTGFKMVYLFQIIISIIIWLIYLLREKIPFKQRTLVLMICLIVLPLPSVKLFGMQGQMGYIAIMYSFLIGMFYGKRWGVLSVIYTFLYVIVLGYFYIIEPIVPDFSNILKSDIFYRLLFRTFLIISVSLVIVFSIVRYRSFFLTTLEDFFIMKSSSEKNEFKYKQLSGLTFEGIMIHDKGIIIDVNQSFVKMVGYSHDELIGKNLINDLIPEKYHKVIYQNMGKNYALPYEVEAFKRDGTIWPIELESRAVEPNNVTTIRVTAIRDITCRKQLRLELQQSEQKFRELFEKSGDSLMILEKGRFVKCNNAAVKLFGYDFAKELLNVKPLAISPEVQPDGNSSAQKADEMISMALKNGTHLFEWVHLKKNKEQFNAEVLLTAMPAIEGKKSIYVVVRDITDRKRYEEEFIDKNNELLAAEEELRAANEELMATTESLQETNEDLIVAKEKAEKSEYKYRSIVENLIGGFYRTDVKGNIVLASLSAMKITGFSEKEFLGQSVASFYVNSAERDLFLEKIKKTGKVYKYSAEFKTKNRGNIFIETNAKIIYDDKGEFNGVEGIFYDVTESKLNEGKLIKLSTAVEQSASTIVITDLNGNIEYTNPKFTELTGYTSEEAIGQNPRVLNAGVQPTEYYEEMWKTITNGKVWKGEFCNKTKQGKLYWESVIITPVKDKNEKIINYLAVKEDITIRRKAEESKQRFNAVVNQTTEGIVIIDASNKYVLVNPAFCRITGYKKEEFLKMNVFDIWVRPKMTGNDLLSDMSKIDAVQQVVLKRKDGIEFFSEILLKTIRVNNEDFVLGIVRDITNRIKRENELISAKEKAEESDKLKTVFLQNMSHEIRTPLNAILGFSSFIGDSELKVDMRKMYVDIIQKSGNQLLQIVDEIMEISMLETKQVSVIEEPVCLNELFLELFSISVINADEKNLKLSVKNAPSDEKVTILCDVAKLTNVLRNLLDNAIKYTNEGFIEYGYQRKGKEIVIYVKDTGIGIKPESQMGIFDRFIQEDEDISDIKGGLGLGLSITKENVELLGGKISLESEKGKGSTFYVTIPYKAVGEIDVEFKK